MPLEPKDHAATGLEMPIRRAFEDAR